LSAPENLQARLAEILLSLLPGDGATVGNAALRRPIETRLRAEGPASTVADYWQVQAGLMAVPIAAKYKTAVFAGGEAVRLRAEERRFQGRIRLSFFNLLIPIFIAGDCS
jgi:hypothetical protein